MNCHDISVNTIKVEYFIVYINLNRYKILAIKITFKFALVYVKIAMEARGETCKSLKYLFAFRYTILVIKIGCDQFSWCPLTSSYQHSFFCLHSLVPHSSK